MEAEKRIRFSAIDLFSGCGGLSLGLRRAGFRVIAAIDNDSLSSDTYRMNHPRTHLIKDDIKSIDPSEMMGELKLEVGDLDLLAGCPPCQGFSTLRTYNGGKKVEEPMNDLVFHFIRFVKALMPKTMMMENVPGLLKDGRMKQILRELECLRYKCHADSFNAVDYGVPQRRLRMILLGSLREPPPFAEPIRRRRTVKGAIGRLPNPQDSKDIVHNYSTRRSERISSLIRHIPKDGGSRKDLPDEYRLKCHVSCNGFKDVYGRMAWGKPAPTVTGGCINPSRGRFLHPEDDRAITLREAAYLQGFPGSYKFPRDRGLYPTAQMIGNAFPPKFAEHHARSLYRNLMEFKDNPG